MGFGFFLAAFFFLVISVLSADQKTKKFSVGAGILSIVSFGYSAAFLIIDNIPCIADAVKHGGWFHIRPPLFLF